MFVTVPSRWLSSSKYSCFSTWNLSGGTCRPPERATLFVNRLSVAFTSTVHRQHCKETSCLITSWPGTKSSYLYSHQTTPLSCPPPSYLHKLTLCIIVLAAHKGPRGACRYSKPCLLQSNPPLASLTLQQPFRVLFH